MPKMDARAADMALAVWMSTKFSMCGTLEDMHVSGAPSSKLSMIFSCEQNDHGSRQGPLGLGHIRRCPPDRGPPHPRPRAQKHGQIKASGTRFVVYRPRVRCAPKS